MIISKVLQCTEVEFTLYTSDGFTTMTLVNSSNEKLVNSKVIVKGVLQGSEKLAVNYDQKSKKAETKSWE